MAGFITSEVDRTNSLITRFLDFARPQHLKFGDRRHHAMLDTAIARFEREQKNIGTSVTVFKNYSPGRPARPLRRRTDGARHRQPAGERRPGQPARRHRHGQNACPIDSEVEIAVIDRGSGIDPKNLENIFNPFFTTKTDGVGFGLAIVSKIVDEHGGRITVESTPGRRQRVSRLPASQATIERTSWANPPSW